MSFPLWSCRWRSLWRWSGYDCILTGFVFDNFSGELAGRVMRRLCPMLEPDGYWLFADFYYRQRESRFWQGLMLRTMYFSARLILQGLTPRSFPIWMGCSLRRSLAPCTGFLVL